MHCLHRHVHHVRHHHAKPITIEKTLKLNPEPLVVVDNSAAIDEMKREVLAKIDGETSAVLLRVNDVAKLVESKGVQHAPAPRLPPSGIDFFVGVGITLAIVAVWSAVRGD